MLIRAVQYQWSNQKDLNKILSATNLAKKTGYDTKLIEIENEIPSTTNLGFKKMIISKY